MGSEGPGGGSKVALSMSQRKAVTKQMAARYAKAAKKQKSLMLDELCELTGWTRRHARRALLEPSALRTPRAPSPRIYGEDVFEPLRFIWATYGGPAGKRLAPFMGEAIDALERHGEISLDTSARDKLLRISASTIDRMLAKERAKLRMKGRHGTKPGSILRRQIPIRTFAEWDELRPGFCEVDLVSHDGGSPVGEHCYTLDLVCVATGWTEMRALKNKAQVWVNEALAEIYDVLPFRLLGLDSDNGSEFINHHLFSWCERNEITFTRTRPYRKNDNCFVEQKNWPVVRQQVGYARYDDEEELRCLEELYSQLRLWVNYFSPQMKLVSKTRHGAQVKKTFDLATTPYRRVLRSEHVLEPAKRELEEIYLSLNPAELRRQIASCQDRLIDLVKTKQQRRKEVWKPPSRPAPDPWKDARARQRYEDIFREATEGRFEDILT
jgi:hypothetical protein